MEKSGKFVPPFDGHEMFGLTSAIVHQILMESPGIEKCTLYAKRYFKSVFQFISKWPVIGQFEKEPEKQTVAQVVKFKFKKKTFGDLLPPLVIDFSALFSNEPKNLIVDVIGEGNELGKMAKLYEQWAARRHDEDPVIKNEPK
jgi:hypothetical protein